MFEVGVAVSERVWAVGLVGLGTTGLDCLADEADELDLDFLANGKLTLTGVIGFDWVVYDKFRRSFIALDRNRNR